MRYGEIAQLKWKDIDFERSFLTLYETKNGSKRVIPLTKKLLEIFKACPSYKSSSPEDFVFTSGKSTQANALFSIRKSFANALRRAGIQDFRFHDLRHTAASHLAMKGATQGELMEILGHRGLVALMMSTR